MCLLPAELLAVVTLHETLKQVLQHQDPFFARVAIIVGKAVQDEVRLHQAKTNSAEMKKACLVMFLVS